MDRVLPPRFVRGADAALETLDQVGRDCEASGEVEGVACVVVIDGVAWRYSAVNKKGTRELVREALTDLAGDLKIRKRR